MFNHNHCPAITWCDNGDLLSVWFSCITEGGREMTILGSRLRAGSDSWEEPSEFYNVPDRNMTGSALVNDNKGRLYFLNGVSIASGYRTNNALILRTSDDNGATWSSTRLINPKRGISSQPIGSGWCTDDGKIVVPSDWPWGKTNGGTALWISCDRGNTWSISQGPIAGIHAGAVDIGKEKFLALGRLKGKDGNKMPMSISNDGGKSWDYSETEFPGVSGGQRLVLRKLQEGPLLLISFTSTRNSKKTMPIRDETGKERDVYGMFAALSFDEGKTWPVKKLITTGGPARQFDGGAWTNEFTMDDNNAEHAGYLSGIQTPDGVFHLISSALHYQFNLAWLKTPMPAETKNTSTIIK
jgi:Neuraminidase (sialidase)